MLLFDVAFLIPEERVVVSILLESSAKEKEDWLWRPRPVGVVAGVGDFSFVPLVWDVLSEEASSLASADEILRSSVVDLTLVALDSARVADFVSRLSLVMTRVTLRPSAVYDSTVLTSLLVLVSLFAELDF